MNKLFEHQKTGVKFLKEKKKVILADEMGLGKTRQAIVAAHLDASPVRYKLVICPASLKINWKREIQMVIEEEDPIIIDGKMDMEEIYEKLKKSSWIIINYDIVNKHLKWLLEIIQEGHIEVLILDEAHYIKNRSQRAKATLQIAEEVDKVYALTGTPMMNRPIELFNILKAIDHPLGEVRYKYSQRYCGAYLRRLRNGRSFVDETGATNLDELREKIGGSMLRRKKKEVLDLPDKIVTLMEIQMTADQKKTYDNAWEDYLEFLKENPIPLRNIDNIVMARQLVELQKLKQVCSMAKTGVILESIENAVEQDEKVIVFSQYTETIDTIKAGLKKKKITCRTLTGKDKMNARQDSVDDFQKDDGAKVFIANIKAGGVGITLTEATIVIFADMDWSPEIHAQAEDRAHRIGQKNMVNIYYYICKDTIEEDIVNLLDEKKKTITQILEGDKKRVKSVSMSEDFLRKMSIKVTHS